MWARMYAADAALIQHRVQEMARSVCEADPRTLAERLADALVALAAGTELACGCGQSDCVAAGRAVPATTAVVHVVADAATVAAAAAAPTPTDGPPPAPAEPSNPAAESAEPATTINPNPGEPAALLLSASQAVSADPPSCPAPPAFVIGGGILPAPLLAATLDCAAVREVRHPGDAPPEPGYRPSRALDEFVRCRDLTCRWPGCDKPACSCDLDHTVPYPVGPTQASNLKCYCRFHHLLKTFYTGAGGWRERQLPDGTLILTSPTGHTYTTRPGSAQLFPALCLPTAALWPPGQEPTVESSGDRGVMMPKRRHTREYNRQRSIGAERRLNDAHVAERNRPPPF